MKSVVLFYDLPSEFNPLYKKCSSMVRHIAVEQSECSNQQGKTKYKQ